MTSKLEMNNWDYAYRRAKYSNEKPIKFIEQIIKTTSNLPAKAKGYYPGCGNGRNLIPLLDAGLNIEGHDISRVAIEQLLKRRPGSNVSVGEYLSTNQHKYDYIISIQLFQHGDNSVVQKLFSKTYNLLKPGGLLFLRVNSTSTQIIEKHTIIETTRSGGFTIRYKSGPKKGQPIHFYTSDELVEILSRKYHFIMPPHEDKIMRVDGTSWAQWESVIKKS